MAYLDVLLPGSRVGHRQLFVQRQISHHGLPVRFVCWYKPFTTKLGRLTWYCDAMWHRPDEMIVPYMPRADGALPHNT